MIMRWKRMKKKIGIPDLPVLNSPYILKHCQLCQRSDKVNIVNEMIVAMT